MRTTLTIAKREFRSYFDSPIAYIVICLSLFTLGVFFFLLGGGFWQTDRASVSQLFVMAPMGIIVLAAVLTMRLLAEEKRSGTLELLITMPVQDHEVVIGKFIGAWGLLLVVILSTVAYPVMMFKFPWHLGALDMWPVFAGYIGIVLYSLAAVSIGLLVSSLTESQIIAFLITLVLLLMMQLIGRANAVFDNKTFGEVVSFLSFETRLAPFARGMINTRDVIYFLSIAVGCLMASFRALERRKWA